MPAILGLISRSDEPVGERLEQMVRPLWRNPAWGIDQIQSPTGGLAAVRRDDSPAIAAAEGVWLAVCGMVFQQDDLVRQLEAAGRSAAGAPLSRLLLELYLMFGRGALTRLNGSYAVAIWEEALERLTLLNDRYGTANLYYWQDGGRFAFASEYKAIVTHPAFSGTVDEVALADFLLFKQVNGDRTFFRQIRALPPASLLVYQQGRVELIDCWQLPVGQYETWRRNAAQQPSGGEVIEEWAHHLQTAVRRQSFPNTCLLITAGLDSRLLAACYRQVNPETPLHTTTIGVQDCQEAKIGRQVADALGYPHEWIPLATTYLARYAAQAAWRAEGKLNAFAAWIYRQEPYLLEHGFRFAMTGILGNAISGRYFPPALAGAGREDGAERLRAALGSRIGWLKSVMRPEVFQFAAPASLDAYSEAYRRARAEDSSGRYDELYFRYILPRHAWKDEVLGDAADSLAPYLDNDLVDFSLTLPPELRAGGQLYRQMIVSKFPAVARLVSNRSGHSIQFDHWLDAHPALHKADDFIRRAYRRMFRNRRAQDARYCVPHNEAIRAGSREFVLEALGREEYLADIFDVQAINMVVNDHLTGRRNLFWLIGGLLTISLWRQQFFGNERAESPIGALQPFEIKTH